MARTLTHSAAASLTLLLLVVLFGFASAFPVSEEKRAAQVPAASYVLALTRNAASQQRSSTVSSRLRNFRAVAEGPTGIATALPAYHDVEYLADVKVGNHKYSLIIDTGSSDTWLVKEGFQCLDANHHVVNQLLCNFGPKYKGDFPDGQIPGQHFNISYGSAGGPFLNGQMGYADLTLAGIEIKKQQIALATIGAWNGDGLSSGILGLGLPGLTEAFVGNTPADDGVQNLVNYNPVITTVSNQVGNGIFSLGLSRNASASFLALGGVPQDLKVGDYATISIDKMDKRFGGTDYFFYTMTPDRLVWNTSTQAKEWRALQVIVDSGTTLNLFPYDIAASINSLFYPRAVYLEQQGGWFVPCNAVPPSFGVQIKGQVLWTDPSSMILQQLRDRETSYCATGIGAAGSQPYILGDVFMQSLVAVFDIGPKMEMRFAKRL
ncbi:aspartic peptidase domain-containing protein [Lasiosphaeria miniovina]|uniref:Aspartic peptidase domain-containing protein n=1 Tax=Lasiosphaeria miniovina TaxID=1954250 RepID=A0AA40EA58_9PEZI|nr:aspartic peptidase domain-containing protein [Lasiosphaeria miniovina]KAK0727983.1 aspartic peptidase domain-containing protein [Lasiosphaeria miniovina]